MRAYVLVYMRVLQRAGMRAHGCGFAHALYRVRVSCAMQKRLKVIHACILQQRSASVSIQLRTRMIHPCHGLPQAHEAKFVDVGHVGVGAKEPTADAPQGSGTTTGGARPTHARGGLRPEGTGTLICWHSVHSSLPRSTPRFLIRQSEIDSDGDVSLSV